MPLTRARQSASLSSADAALSSDELDLLPKARLSSVAMSRSNSHRSVASCSVALGSAPLTRTVRARGGALQRTVSSPAGLRVEDTSSSCSDGTVSCSSSITTRSHKSSSGNSSCAPSTSSSASSSTRMSRGTSFGSRRSLAVTGEDDSDPSDDEFTPCTSRLGGCSVDVDPLSKRDDSNKENVAPFRQVSESVLTAEALDRERESAARRSRSRRGSFSARSTSSSGSITSSIATSSARPSLRRPVNSAQATIPTTPRRVSSRSTATSSTDISTRSQPPSLRKRQRHSSGTDARDTDVRTPGTPMSRLRLDTDSANASDDAESYFSSQGSASTTRSSLFDMQSERLADADAASRGTTPDEDALDKTLTPSGEEEQKEHEEATKTVYSNVYAHARGLLRYAAGTSIDLSPSDNDQAQGSSSLNDGNDVQVVGRDTERKALHAFMSRQFGIFSESSSSTSSNIEDLLDGNTDSGSLYICGLPGTGKTALVRSVLTDVLAMPKSDDATSVVPPRVAFVNCMAVTHPRQIFVKVLTALGEDVKGASESHAEAEAERKMDKLITSHQEDGQKTLIVLDEIDHLLRSRAHQNVLYRLFAWASETQASCALIGIANSLDLTERFVPLLASKGAAPALLHFRPFESQEIVQVIKSRLVGLQARYDGEAEDEAMADVTTTSPAVLFVPAALELASKKIAAATGDLRKALDAARLAIELVEGEQRRQALVNCTASGTGTNTQASKLLSHLTPSSAPKVTPSHILKVLSSVLGSPHLSKLRQLGLQPKLLLAAMIVALKRASQGMPVLGSNGQHKSSSTSTTSADSSSSRVADVESTYHAMLSNDGSFSALESSEVFGIFELLEVQGLISLHADVEGNSPTSSSSTLPASVTSSISSSGSGVSPGGKRAAKRQLLASNRRVRLLLPIEDVQKGITTVASTLGGGISDGELPSQAIVDCVKKMLSFEEERIRRNRGWEAIAKERELVRGEELGGGRMARWD